MRRSAWSCRPCGKQSYPSQSRAESVIDWVATTTNRQQLPTRAYPCPHDNGWHLTSQRERVHA